ncbi:MAG TPA: hypothetical protein DDW80_06485, partial [Desulfovibrio sp.]|nr:hypothetical protein [Desulfovibrio sp.]
MVDEESQGKERHQGKKQGHGHDLAAQPPVALGIHAPLRFCPTFSREKQGLPVFFPPGGWQKPRGRIRRMWGTLFRGGAMGDIPATAARILVVDDDPVFRVYFAELLGGMGHEVRTAGDGEEGLRLLRDWAPDMLLLDLRMPGLDGLAVLDAVAAEAPGVPVIVVSGTTDIRH